MSAPGPKITLQLDPEAQAAVTEEDLPAPIPLHPFSIERIGKRRGFQALKACAAGHTLEVFDCAHAWRLFAELDGRRLIRARKRRRPYRHYSKDPLVRRWILADAMRLSRKSQGEGARDGTIAITARLAHDEALRLADKSRLPEADETLFATDKAPAHRGRFLANRARARVPRSESGYPMAKLAERSESGAGQLVRAPAACPLPR